MAPDAVQVIAMVVDVGTPCRLLRLGRGVPVETIKWRRNNVCNSLKILYISYRLIVHVLWKGVSTWYTCTEHHNKYFSWTNNLIVAVANNKINLDIKSVTGYSFAQYLYTCTS
jgi:hypothetical protein